MTDFIGRFRERVRVVADELARSTSAVTTNHPAPGKWSANEILGHLIDSAANNHRRFVMAPAMRDMIFDGYDQDAWVDAQRYDEADWQDLVRLWRSYNLHIAHVMAAVPLDVRERMCSRHDLHEIAFRPVGAGEPVSLGWLMEDYVAHMEHHLSQIHALVAGRPAPHKAN